MASHEGYSTIGRTCPPPKKGLHEEGLCVRVSPLVARAHALLPHGHKPGKSHDGGMFVAVVLAADDTKGGRWVYAGAAARCDSAATERISPCRLVSPI